MDDGQNPKSWVDLNIVYLQHNPTQIYPISVAYWKSTELKYNALFCMGMNLGLLDPKEKLGTLKMTQFLKGGEGVRWVGSMGLVYRS